LPGKDRHGAQFKAEYVPTERAFGRLRQGADKASVYRVLEAGHEPRRRSSHRGPFRMDRRANGRNRSGILFSVEGREELTKRCFSGLIGQIFRTMRATPQSNRQRLSVVTNLPLPRKRVGLPHHNRVFSIRHHATIVREFSHGCQQSRRRFDRSMANRAIYLTPPPATYSVRA
jgi:hypothetical protein